MQEVDNVIFLEEQKFGPWLRWLVYLSMGISPAITVFALVKESGPDGLLAGGEIFLAVGAGIGVPIAITALFLLLKLQTEVRPDGIYVRFFPFHIRFKRFAREDLSECYARQYKPIREFGGWGIRYSISNGRAYNVSGDKGVQLVFHTGKKLLIGSHTPEQLEAAIRSIM